MFLNDKQTATPAPSTAEFTLRGRIAAHESWANTPDRSARTAPARAALDAKFLEQAGGDPVRAEHLRKAHFARLSLRSAQSRRRARELTEAAVAAEAKLAAVGGDAEDDLRDAKKLSPDAEDELHAVGGDAAEAKLSDLTGGAA